MSAEGEERDPRRRTRYPSPKNTNNVNPPKSPRRPPTDDLPDENDFGDDEPPPLRAKPATSSSARQRDVEGNATSPRTNKPPAEGPGWLERMTSSRVGSGRMSQFCRQWGQYLNAGFSVDKSLQSLQTQYASTPLGAPLGRIRQALRNGDDITAACGREPAFDPLFLSLIRVAEARGGIPETLKDLAKLYERRQRLYRKTLSALWYPAIVLIIAGGVCALLTFLVLPLMSGFLQDLVGRGRELPLPSRILMGLSAFLTSVGWWLVPVIGITAVIVLTRWYRTASGRAFLDRVLYRIPVFGKLLRLIDYARFTRALSALLEGGVAMNESLKLSRETIHLVPIRNALKQAAQQVRQGAELSVALEETGFFPEETVAQVNSGEETGTLPEALGRLANDYQEQVELMVDNLGNLLQPLIVVFLGGIVLFIILAVILPYISMISGLAG